ncbi:ABC transporter ATP-binding protein [Collimonas humicola]|uniref:ABC transporter ATP-binding protein n=1 Tax=Collimonas humicola TaxID=2825886 RepID=UPI001B8CC380|nr:sn-glycerol-3-phosphate ABC transporter ATP-binding protein UgpC [Collimonas humicola]
MADLIFKGIHKRYGAGLDVIRDVNLTIKQSEFCVFVGPSGCGKSTLLRMVAGLEDISSGELLLGDVRMNEKPPTERGVAMVFQSYALYPHMTVYDNMAFGLKILKTSTDTVDKKVREAARILQLEPLLKRLPKELSGGQRQRVAIGRAIVRQPQIFLFDEPLSNLDAALRVQTRLEIAKLHTDIGTSSMIYVTHDQVEAMTLADKIVLLNAGHAVTEDGSIAQIGTPLELYHHPVNRFVAGFIGSPAMNFLPARVHEIGAHGVTLVLPDGTQLTAEVAGNDLLRGAPASFGIRPEHLSINDAGQLKGRVRHVEHMGELSYLYVDLPGLAVPLVVKQAGTFSGQAGGPIRLAAPAANAHLFDANGRARRRLPSAALG